MGRYKYYESSQNEVIAVTRYRGRNVRGVAKCNPKDDYYFSIGAQLAQARCKEKVAKIRKNDAIARIKMAQDAYIKAFKYYQKCIDYLEKDEQFYENAIKARKDVEDKNNEL